MFDFILSFAYSVLFLKAWSLQIAAIIMKSLPSLNTGEITNAYFFINVNFWKWTFVDMQAQSRS